MDAGSNHIVLSGKTSNCAHGAKIKRFYVRIGPEALWMLGAAQRNVSAHVFRVTIPSKDFELEGACHVFQHPAALLFVR